MEQTVLTAYGGEHAGHGHTVVVITHRYQLAMAAGRVIVLDGSSIVEEGAPSDSDEARRSIRQTVFDRAHEPRGDVAPGLNSEGVEVSPDWYRQVPQSNYAGSRRQPGTSGRGAPSRRRRRARGERRRRALQRSRHSPLPDRSSSGGESTPPLSQNRT